MFRAWKSFRKHFLSDIYYMFTPSLTQAYYIGYIGHGNVGDEAIYYATKKLFARRIKFHSAEVSNSIIEKILFADFKSIFLGGGTLIKGPSIQFKRIKSILYKYNSIPFIIFGTGVGDADMWERLGFKTDKAAWREIVDRSTYLGVRGPLSKQFLYEWGVSKEAHVIGDPALLLADNELKPKPKKRGKHIGINLGYTLWDKKLVRKQTQRTLEFGMRLLKYCSEEGWSITLFAMCPEDEDFLSKTLSLAGVPIFSFIKPDTNLLHIIQILGEQDVFIGMKLHSVVLASCKYTPSIMIEYRTKCRDFMKSIGREEFNHSLSELNFDNIIYHIQQLYEQSEAHQYQIYPAVQAKKKLLIEAGEKILSLITTSL